MVVSLKLATWEWGKHKTTKERNIQAATHSSHKNPKTCALFFYFFFIYLFIFEASPPVL